MEVILLILYMLPSFKIVSPMINLKSMYHVAAMLA